MIMIPCPALIFFLLLLLFLFLYFCLTFHFCLHCPFAIAKAIDGNDCKSKGTKIKGQIRIKTIAKGRNLLYVKGVRQQPLSPPLLLLQKQQGRVPRDNNDILIISAWYRGEGLIKTS